MSTQPALANCECGSIGAPDGVRLTACHHRYFRGDKELTSVSRLIKSTWPLKPNFAAADPDVLEKARVRGVLVDSIFTAYLRREPQVIPAGTRDDIVEESRDLWLKLRTWWDRKPAGKTQTQVILADEELAGTADIITEGVIADLKTTYDIEAFYPIQLGLYAELYEKQTGHEPAGLGIIHLTKRFSTPRWISLDMDECRRDARLLRDTWRMVQRRTS